MGVQVGLLGVVILPALQCVYWYLVTMAFGGQPVFSNSLEVWWNH